LGGKKSPIFLITQNWKKKIKKKIKILSGLGQIIKREGGREGKRRRKKNPIKSCLVILT
jgi:hypothetical protein